MGLEVDESHYYTSALATAKIVSGQMPGASAYVIGEAGLYNALHEAGIAMNERGSGLCDRRRDGALSLRRDPAALFGMSGTARGSLEPTPI